MTNEMFLHIRLFLKLSQEEYSKFTGISRPLIARIEAGNLAVSRRTKAKILSVFDINDKFLSFHEKMRNIS
jgi:transcriptional regulator with XRE-family HTH domain